MLSLQDAANIIHSMSPHLLPDMEAEEEEEEEGGEEDAEDNEPQVCSMVDATASLLSLYEVRRGCEYVCHDCHEAPLTSFSMQLQEWQAQHLGRYQALDIYPAPLHRC